MELGPLQLANSRAEWLMFLSMLPCSMYGRTYSSHDPNWLGNGGWPILPPVTKALVGNTAPEAVLIGRLRPGVNLPLVPSKLCIARPSCLRLLLHDMRAAASRTFCTAGSKRPIRIAMI